MKKFTTYSEIENLCEAMIKDFMKRKHYTNAHCVDIEAFVTEYLGIPIVYETFAEPDPGRIGFLSDGIRPLWVVRGNEKKQVLFPKNTVVLEKYLQTQTEIGRKRFTIAHEGAHFVLSKHIPAQTDAYAAFHSEFDTEMVYSPEMLREMLSINESFGNRAAACLLMPKFLVLRLLKQYNGGSKVIAYDDYVMSQEQKIIVQRMADAMGVNYSPLITRLKELDLFDKRPMPDNSILEGSKSTPSGCVIIALPGGCSSSMTDCIREESDTSSSSGFFTPRLTVKLPCGSASTSKTFLPESASPTPRLTAVVVLPTPPF